MSTFSGKSEQRQSLTINPERMNTRSKGTLLPQTDRYLHASFDKNGKRQSSDAHQISGLASTFTGGKSRYGVISVRLIASCVKREESELKSVSEILANNAARPLCASE